MHVHGEEGTYKVQTLQTKGGEGMIPTTTSDLFCWISGIVILLLFLYLFVLLLFLYLFGWFRARGSGLGVPG